MRPCPDASHRSFSIRRLLPIVCAAAAVCVIPARLARAQQYDYDPDTNAWTIPQPSATKGEFKGDDPIGLASRQHIPTDCSIQWQDDDSGKIYCFASTMSSQIFQEQRSSLLPKATAFWAEEHPKKPDISDGVPAASRR